MVETLNPLVEHLVDAGILNEGKRDHVLRRQEQTGTELSSLLLEDGMLGEDDLFDVLADRTSCLVLALEDFAEVFRFPGDA